MAALWRSDVKRKLGALFHCICFKTNVPNRRYSWVRSRFPSSGGILHFSSIHPPSPTPVWSQQHSGSSKATLGRLQQRQNVLGLLVTAKPSPKSHLDSSTSPCSGMFRLSSVRNVPAPCAVVLARFPLGQSVAAAEHPGLAWPSIRRQPRLSASSQKKKRKKENMHAHTHKHTHIPSKSWTRTNVQQASVRGMPRPPATLLKGYSCRLRGKGATSSTKIQSGQQDAASALPQHRPLSAAADGNPEDINPNTFAGHKCFIIQDQTRLRASEFISFWKAGTRTAS